MKPYAPNLINIPAKITDPATGASTWAKGNQIWNGNIGILTAKLAKKHGKKFVYEISGQMQETRKKQLKKIYKKYKIPLDTGIDYLQKRRIKEAIIADIIICPSLILKKELCKLGFNKKKNNHI